MAEVTVVIPNYNGSAYLPACLDALRRQKYQDFHTIVVDNGSSDESRELVKRDYPEVRLITLPENRGFCGAVNIGIRESRTPYVILLNNDTEAEAGFVGGLLRAIRKDARRFSCSAKMVQFHDRDRIDDAGNYYTALGWAYAWGKGRPQKDYCRERKIFAACAGAAIYRKDVLERIGGFDEVHFAYLEDVDVGYRARIQGYVNVYAPKAVVCHVGSATTGSRYNSFKVQYSARNNIYLIYKNMPFFQIVLNLPFLAAGFLIKFLFFVKKGLGKDYLTGLKRGLKICEKSKKVRFSAGNFCNYCKIQAELWLNIVRILTKF